MDPLSIAGVAWGVTATGWFVSPYITRLLDKAYAHIFPRKSKAILSQMNHTITRLKLILEAAEGSAYKDLFEQLLKDLKSALYDTESIMNEVEYIRRFKSGKKREWPSVMKDGIPGKRPKNGTKSKLDLTFNQASSNQDVGTSSSVSIPGPLRSRLKDTLTEIEEIITRAHEILELLKMKGNMGSDEHIQNVPAKNINRHITSDPTGKVTGREDVIKDIRDRLRQTEDTGIKEKRQRLSAIGIIGIPGSGKTTLAQCVCQSERSDSYFELVMWIHVSNKFSMGRIYGEMFEQAWKRFGGSEKKPKYSGLESLKDELKNVLNGKTFLLIFDDIWFGDGEDTYTDDKLKEILIPVMGGKRESKILITSRQDSLLRLGRDVRSTTYPIPDLDDTSFFELFMNYALDEDRVKKEDERRIQQIGAEIAVKLKKSPLLARVVGSFLFHKRKIEVSDWRSVRDQNLLDKYMGALWWSYQHLSEQVRRCFAYCSIFPRTYHLHRDELVNLWVAEGFIDSTNIGHEMESVGRSYFDELVSSSFLLPGGKDYRSGKEYFMIHDLLYDLAVKVAGDDCLKIENGWPSDVPENVRHLSIQRCSPSMVSKDIVKLKRLRTLIIYNFEAELFSFKDKSYGHKNIEDKGYENMFHQLCELRVLIVAGDTDSGVGHIYFPRDIVFSKYLRYIGVHRKWGNYEVTLPDTVEKLYLLQVVDLGSAAVIHSSFSDDLIKLADLRHVYNEGGSCFANIERLASLRTMPGLDISNGEGHELYQLEHLNNLEGKLVIGGLGCVKTKDEAVNAKLAHKKLLTELELSCYGERIGSNYSQDLQEEVLEALFPPENITYLKISYYESSRYPTWMVCPKESTIHLSKLVLKDCAQPDCRPGTFFISVTSLQLEFCWWDTLPDMKYLTSLQLGPFSLVPSSLENLTSLERLVIYDSYVDTVPILPSSLRYIEIRGCHCREAEDQISEKVKHIPEIVLSNVQFNAALEGWDVLGRARDLVADIQDARIFLKELKKRARIGWFAS